MTTDVVVRGMTCQGCESVVETAVEMLDGVRGVDADRYESVVHVDGDVAPEDIIEQVELAGYKAEPIAVESTSSSSTEEGQPVIDEMSADETEE